MAEPLGRGLYRGLLRDVARVWNPSEIQDISVRERVLEQMHAADRGLRRLEATLNNVGSERHLILRSMDSVRLSASIPWILQALTQCAEIGAAFLDEPGQFLQLRDADRRLHVGQLQVVADVRVGVFVVVAAGQFAELPVEAFAAGVVLARARTSSRGPSRGRIRRASCSSGLSVSTAPPSPIVMWCAG